MLNEAQISLTGYVATQPVIKTVHPTGTTNLTMRVAWTPRRQDRTTGEWVDGNTSYVTVICWRKLASNVAVCVRKGDPVVVQGRLSVRPFEDKDGMARLAVEVDASSVGHDLSRGVAAFSRVRPPTGMTASEFDAARGTAGQSNGTAGQANGASGQADGTAGQANGASGQANGASGQVDGASGQVNGTADQAGGAAGFDGSQDPDVPMPEEPQDGFFDEAAISEVVTETASAG